MDEKPLEHDVLQMRRAEIQEITFEYAGWGVARKGHYYEAMKGGLYLWRWNKSSNHRRALYKVKSKTKRDTSIRINI